jgi:hypothetical protein
MCFSISYLWRNTVLLLASWDDLRSSHSVESNMITLYVVNGFVEANAPRLGEIESAIEGRVRATKSFGQIGEPEDS